MFSNAQNVFYLYLTFFSQKKKRHTYFQVTVESICDQSSYVKPSIQNSMESCGSIWIGDDQTGKICYCDADCLDLYSTGSCDLSLNRCRDVRIVMEREFLSCVLSQLNSITISSILQTLVNINFLEPKSYQNLTVDILLSYLQGPGCVSDYGPMSHRRKAYVMTSFFPFGEQLCQTVSYFEKITNNKLILFV
jgi:hypothetical protein